MRGRYKWNSPSKNTQTTYSTLCVCHFMWVKCRFKLSLRKSSWCIVYIQGLAAEEQPQCWSVCDKSSWLLPRQVTIIAISCFCPLEGDHFDKNTTCHTEQSLLNSHSEISTETVFIWFHVIFLQIKNRWVAGAMTYISFQTNRPFGLISLFSSLEVSLEIKWPLNDAGNTPSGPRGSRFNFMFFIRPWVGLSG